MNIANFQSILEGTWGVLLIVLFFGGSIFIHELGHFLAARKRGLKIERFSIGMGPRLFGWTGKDGIDYRVSLLPIGGYVALPQMVDMQAIEGKNDTDPEVLPPISYADKMIVAVMGATFNLLFAFALACVLWLIKMPGSESTTTTTIGYIVQELPGRDTPSPAVSAGLLPGDKVLAVDGSAVHAFKDIVEKVYFCSTKDDAGKPLAILKIQRGTEILEVRTTPQSVELNPSSGDSIYLLGIGPASEVVIAEPSPGTPAAKAGMREGDEIIAMNDTAIFSLRHLRDLLEKNGTDVVKINVRNIRDGQERVLTMTPTMKTETAALTQISFTENGKKHSQQLVAVPDELFTKDAGAERKNLMIFDTLPTTSNFSAILKPGTVITSIDLPDGIRAIRSAGEFVAAASESKNDTVTLFTRNGEKKQNVTLENFKVESIPEKKSPYIGIINTAQSELIRKSPVTQFSEAVSTTFITLAKLFDPNSNVQVNHLMGVVSMAKAYYTLADDIRRIVWFTIVINVNLAILNLLPLPVLDGGHMLFATIQKIRRKPLPVPFIATCQYVFIGLFIALMFYVIMNDLRRCKGDDTLELRNEIIARYVLNPVSFDEPEK